MVKKVVAARRTLTRLFAFFGTLREDACELTLRQHPAKWVLEVCQTVYMYS